MPSADDPPSPSRPPAAWIEKAVALRPGEWAAVALIAAAIVVVTKAVIQDEGSSWPSVAVLALLAAFAVVHLWKWVRSKYRSL